MKLVVFGATGTAGSGILRACLDSPRVSEVRAVTRRPLGLTHPKLTVFLHDDYLDYGRAVPAFAGVSACLFALGISVRQVSGEEEYRRITHGFALAAAAALHAGSPDGVFHFISGRSTDAGSRFMWARVKGETERDLPAVAPTVCWRPAFIDGGSVASGPRLDRALRPVLRILFGWSRSLYVKSEDIGRAMIQATAEGLRAGIIENPAIRDLADRERCAPRAPGS